MMMMAQNLLLSSLFAWGVVVSIPPFGSRQRTCYPCYLSSCTHLQQKEKKKKEKKLSQSVKCSPLSSSCMLWQIFSRAFILARCVMYVFGDDPIRVTEDVFNSIINSHLLTMELNVSYFSPITKDYLCPPTLSLLLVQQRTHGRGQLYVLSCSFCFTW